MERNENGLFVNRRTVGMGSSSAPFMPGDDSARISFGTEREGCGRDNGMTSPTPRDGGKMGEDIVRQITKKVNGGQNGIAQRLFYYRRFKKEFGF